MALFNRITGFNDDGTDYDGSAGDKLPLHQLFAALREFARGNATRTQLDAFFAFGPNDLDELITKYGTLSAKNKPLFMEAVGDWMILGEQSTPGYRTHAEWAALIQGF